MTAGWAPNLSLIRQPWHKNQHQFIHFIYKTDTGDFVLSACLQTVSDWLWTPSSASKITTPPSKHEATFLLQR